MTSLGLWGRRPGLPQPCPAARCHVACRFRGDPTHSDGYAYGVTAVLHTHRRSKGLSAGVRGTSNAQQCTAYFNAVVPGRCAAETEGGI